MKNDIEKIAKNHGKKKQTLKAIEELSELIRALSRGDIDNIIEEIADVEIMLAQLKQLYVIEIQAITDIKKFKIEREIKRMNVVNGYTDEFY